MEIVIRTEGSEQASVQGAAQASAAAPPTAVAARAEQLGAINAGPAHIPAGGTGEPIPDVVAAVFSEPVAHNGGYGMSAGSSAGFVDETAATIVEAEGE